MVFGGGGAGTLLARAKRTFGADVSCRENWSRAQKMKTRMWLISDRESPEEGIILRESITGLEMSGLRMVLGRSQQRITENKFIYNHL